VLASLKAQSWRAGSGSERTATSASSVRDPDSSDTESSSEPSDESSSPVDQPRGALGRPLRALELFAGQGGLSRALGRRGFKVLAYELFDEAGNEQPEFDLSRWSVVLEVLRMLRSGMIKFVHLGTPCESFSVLRQCFGSSTRTVDRPEGDGSCPKEVLGNRLARHSAAVIRTALQCDVWFTLENPDRSMLWQQASIRALARLQDVRRIKFDQCCFGLRDPGSKLLYRKRTVIMTNLPDTSPLEYFCSRDHKHEPIEGSVSTPQGWKSRSKLAGVYPPALCDAIAKCAAHACI
jgi:hypothetical protein